MIKTGDMLIDRMLISLRANNSKQAVSKEFKDFVSGGGDTEIKYAISDFFDTNDIAVFPVWLDNFNFYLQAMTENQAYQLGFKEINLAYNGREFSGIHIPSDQSGFNIYPNPVQEEILIKTENQTGKFDIDLFNLSGQKVRTLQTEIMTGNTIAIPVQKLKPGYYLLTIKQKQNQKKSTFKIIKN
jgi:NAD kinase